MTSIEELIKTAQAGTATVTELAEVARAAAVGAKESQSGTAAVLADAQSNLATITTTVTQAVAAKTKISDDQTLIALKSEQIQKAQEHADKIRAELDRVLNSVTQQAIEVETQKARAQLAAESAINHLKEFQVIKELEDAAKSAITDAAEFQKLAATTLSEAQSKMVESATQASASKTQIAEIQAVIATKSDHIQKAQEHADKVRAELDRALTSAAQQAIEAEAQKTRAQLAADSAINHLKEFQATKEFGDAAKSAITDAAEAQKLAAITLAEAHTKIAECATQALASKTQIADIQAVIATKSDHIQKAQEHADKVRAELDRTLTSATQQATEAEGWKSRAQSAADNATALLTEVRTSKGSVETDISAIVAARRVAEESSVQTQNLANKAATVEARISDYEKRLAELDTLCATQLKLIEKLLPGATAAGLASAFDSRRKLFEKPHTGWQKIFVGSLLAIVALAGTGLWHVYNSTTPPSYDELLRLWLARLPIVGALVWLALHASHQSALAKRLEEDYGYKAAVASCLMGFQKQLQEVGTDAASNPSLTKLLDNALTTISAPPGRIYDKHALTVSPSKELTEAAKAAAELAGAGQPGPK